MKQMKNQTNQEVLDLLDKGVVTIKLTGVSFDNRQKTIKNMMVQELSREISLQPETDNKWDDYAIGVINCNGDIIGFIPKNKNFSINLPTRRRPISFGKHIVSVETGKSMQTNEIFHQDMLDTHYTGKIDKYLTYGTTGEVPIGIQVIFKKM